jgi:putative addiction module component (TIGR02574 family)
MSTLVEELSRQALALSTAERVELAEKLLATVQAVDEEVEAAWDEEIKRRIAEIDDGSAKLIPAEEVFAELRRLIAR